MKTGIVVGLAVSLGATSVVSARYISGPLSDQYIDFEQQPVGTNVNGLTIGNIQFSFSTDRGIDGAFIGAGFGPTANTVGKMIEGPTSGQLGLNFTRPVLQFSFGFALLAEGFVQNAISIDLFDTNGDFISTLTYDADSPSDVRGGGAEYSTARVGATGGGGGGSIGSAIISFAETQDPFPVRGDTPITRFAFDELAVDFRAIPLPSAALMAGVGLFGLTSRRRRRCF